MQIGPFDAGVLARKLREQSEINDPFAGAASPAEVEAHSKLWPESPRWQHIELVCVTDNGVRRLEEYRFTPASTASDLPEIHGPGLPVAIVFERLPNGASHARIYSAHQLVPDRSPILAVDDDLVLDRGPNDIMASYFTTLRSADLDGSVALFEPDGYLQHSNGETYRGATRIRLDFIKFFQTGGIKLRYCNRMDEGARTVYEVYMPSGRPAVAVYERGRSGKVGGVRLYL